MSDLDKLGAALFRLSHHLRRLDVLADKEVAKAYEHVVAVFTGVEHNAEADKHDMQRDKAAFIAQAIDDDPAAYTDDAQFLRYRLALNVSQATFADMLGMARETVGKMERGQMPIEKRTMLAARFIALKGV